MVFAPIVTLRMCYSHSRIDWNWVRFLQTLEAIAALWIFIGLVALSAGGVQGLEAGRMAEWPAAPGRVVTSESVTTAFRGLGLRYAPAVRIVYEYEVGGTVYRSERVAVEIQPVETDSAEGQRRLRDYPVGTEVTVYYDPDDPAAAVLECGRPGSAFAAGAALIAMGLVVAAARWLLRKRPLAAG
jgi:hypothetical protein